MHSYQNTQTEKFKVVLASRRYQGKPERPIGYKKVPKISPRGPELALSATQQPPAMLLAVFLVGGIPGSSP